MITESEWLTSEEPERLLLFLTETERNDRKFRLFGCACGRRVWDFLAADQLREAVETAEARSDEGADWNDAHVQEERAQAALLRDVFGNPFRPVTLALGRRTAAVISLARAAYDERQLPSGVLDAFRLAVLADSLEEAGAPDQMVVHLRGPGPHVRGCWAVDLCLGLS